MLRKAAVLIIVLAFLAPTIQADNKDSYADDNDKTVVIDNIACAMFASDGATVLMGTGKLVIEKYEVNFICKGTQPKDLVSDSTGNLIPYPDKPVRFTGLEMGLEYPVFTPTGEVYTILNWKEVVTPKGKVTLKGEINLKPHDKENVNSHDKEDKDDSSEK